MPKWKMNPFQILLLFASCFSHI